MDISGLLALADDMPEFGAMVKEIEAEDSAGATLIDNAKPFVISALYKRFQKPILVITPQADSSRKMYELLVTWNPYLDVRLFPDPEALAYERISTDISAALERVQVLSALTGMNGKRKPPVVVASAAAFVQKLASREEFTGAGHDVTRDMEIEPFDLIMKWQAMGYRLEEIVDMPGTISHRGGIIDVFPPTAEMPARLEFWGNTIDSIRFFDPATQRSIRDIKTLTISPAAEILKPFSGDREELESKLRGLDITSLSPDMQDQYSQEIGMLLEKEMPGDLHFYAPLFNRDSLLDYLPEDSLIILDEPENIRIAVEDYSNRAEELRAEKLELQELPVNYPVPYFTWGEIEPGVGKRRNLKLTSFGAPEEEGWHELPFVPGASYTGQMPLLMDRTKDLLLSGKRIVMISHQSSRLAELLDDEDVIAVPVETVTELPPPGSLTLVQGLISGGWTAGDTVLFTDTEIFGFVKQRRLLKKRPVPHHRVFTDINPGDYVVHIEHGIGRFAGITRMKADSGRGEKEYMILEYASGDRLYVPTDQIDRVGRYVGSGEQDPSLNRLGTQEWSRTKRKVKEAVEEIAEDLVALYASREVIEGHAYQPDTVWQQEVEAAFPYVETPDQITVQRQIKEDMEKTKPMDRLVCGDVGYGKTEVAIRAAFKAVMDGKQVAVLVPTTVLAEQHYTTFKQRLNAFPVKVDVLSRFRSKAVQKRIVKDLSEGKVDICIGTHRIIQKDIVFKDLGLLIIDEEQRFGVNHKEYLKQVRQEVDVLTLSATPIPRTLHMSLVGVRDMSVMETPPEERLPIKTYVSEFKDHLVREAILRELERNGQVFFLHNRVQSIGLITEKLKDIVPEARFSIGHGQMAEGELERVMASFARKESDVLVCTSIIQSGLDMPNVNTLIVNRADKFGLTQLHQLRGRVGRGTETAYAYFLYDRGQKLTPIAEMRLRTIVEASELGAGFSIAMKDLEIRGAGTLLGMKQSGHISAVGFNLYTQLLAQAVEDQKSRQAGVSESEIISSKLPPPSIDLPIPAFIPTDYITDLLTRLDMYQKLADVEKMDDVQPLLDEFIDRFGELPDEVENLFYGIGLRILGSGKGIGSISTEKGDIVITPFEGLSFERERLERLYMEGVSTGRFQVRLDMRRLRNTWKQTLVDVVMKIT